MTTRASTTKGNSAPATTTIDPILARVLGPDAAQLPLELATRVADALRASATPAANTPQEEENLRHMASRGGLLYLLEATHEENGQRIDAVDYLLCSIRDAARQDGEWAAALCLIGSHWAMSVRHDHQQFASRLAAIRQRVERDEREGRA